MARRLYFDLILFICIFATIKTMELPDQHNLSDNDIEAARDLYYPSEQHDTMTYNHVKYAAQDPLPSPDYLRARWIELYHKMKQNHQT
ncbi:unnamed protein product [Adineta ricciae]|uniref:Uncharacterized protein n=1 Tax=Adineta ricciae TaxID=249248 RepID=A0A814EHC7_ADIRI|nr:unnamed protein product [Adineta ricciae]